MLLIEADSGKVLHAEHATHPWYPASITKVMTAYVALKAVKANKLQLDSLLTVSARAAAQSPSKMGFKAGTQVTVDNAIKMLMVKSANDIAVVLAEGVSGTVEEFATEMNETSRRLGMTQSRWVNPNGLPDEGQVSSARDLAILARAMLREFPEYDVYWNIPAIKLGKRMMRNTNSLIGRYPGADGMKTGFICASGFNLVASATRGNRRLIAVVLGSPSSPVRGAKTAGLLERGFNTSGGGLSIFAPSLGSVDALQPVSAAPPDMREEMCGKHRKRPAAEEADEEPATVASGDSSSPQAFLLSSLPPSSGKVSALLGPVPAIANPVIVYAGPAKRPADSVVAVARAKTDARKKNAKQVASASPVQTEAEAAAPGQIAPAGQFTRSNRGSMPGVGETNTGWMSFAPAANAAPAPLTSAPKAGPGQVGMPMPKPRPKAAKRTAAAPAPAQ
jgi:D-alanyl-D-alanine carboxypeptidase